MSCVSTRWTTRSSCVWNLFHGELGAFLRDVGVPKGRIARFSASRRLNGSDAKRMDGTPEEIAERPAVYDLDRDDFERFGYDA